MKSRWSRLSRRSLLLTSGVSLGVAAIACSSAPDDGASASSSEQLVTPMVAPPGNTITWLPQYQFDTGAKPAVAMGGFGNYGEWTIEVHEGDGAQLWSTSTTSGFKSNTLGSWNQFAAGYNPAITNLFGGAQTTAYVLAVAQLGPNPGAIFSYTGEIQLDGATTWGYSTLAASGYAPTVSAYNGVAVEAHMKTNVASGYTQLYDTVGSGNGTSFQWGNSALYDNGVNPSVAVWNNTVVEVHQAGTTEGPLWYHVGTIANGVVAWGPSRQYDNGLNPSIAFSNEGYLVEVHQAAVGTSALWYHVGTLGASQSVNWSASYNYDTGNFPKVAWDQKDDIGTEMHQAGSGVGAMWAHPFYLTCPAGQVSYQGACTACGKAGDEACVTGCNPGNVLSGNTCVACGAIGQPECTTGCNAGLVFDQRNNTCAQVLTASTTVAAYGNGAVTASVQFAAVSNGTVAMKPIISNTNQLTGFDYILECHVGPHEVALTGNIGNAGINVLGGSSTSVSPGTKGIVSPQVTSDWTNIQNIWKTGFGGPADFKCNLSAESTLDETLNGLWSTITGAYLQWTGFDTLTQGDMCGIFCTTSNCPADCSSADIGTCADDDDASTCDTMGGIAE